MKLKKIYSLVLIVFISSLFGGLMSYVKAAYIDPISTPNSNNTPSPVLITDVSLTDWLSGKPKSFAKQGKIGITSDKDTKPVDQDQFASNSLVVMGQLSTDSFTSFTTNRIFGQLESSSKLYPLFVGNPTNSSFMQTNSNSSPLTFKVTDHTRTPRIVIGSKTAPGDIYNVYLVEGDNSTNIGKALDSSTYTGGPGGLNYTINNKTSFCTLTEAQLSSNGCPTGTYMGQIFPDPNTGSNGDIVATCHQTTPQASSYPYSNWNKGSCY